MVPSGFIPNEDVGMFYAIIQPARIVIERTNDISVKLQKIAEGVEGANQLLCRLFF
jgi:HAE1 family hydrophobic/amphiphilic exporter-1